MCRIKFRKYKSATQEAMPNAVQPGTKKNLMEFNRFHIRNIFQYKLNVFAMRF